MIRDLFDHLKRWRTWVVNVLLVVLLSPELINALLGFDWAEIVPKAYMPYVTLAVIVLNVWMRPRPASLAHDPEVQVRKAIDRQDGPVQVEVKAEGLTKAVIHG